MSQIARFKKPGGIEKLLSILENADTKTRDNMMGIIKAEDPAFFADIQARLFLWSDLFQVDERTLTEIVRATPVKLMALALTLVEEHKKQMIFHLMAHVQLAALKDEMDLLQKGVDQARIATARRKVIEVARSLEKEKVIALKKAA